MIDWAKYPNFSEVELHCHCGCGQALMDEEFMALLQSIRNGTGPLPVTSGYRCPDYNLLKNGGPAHPLGRAVDIALSGKEAHKLVNIASLFGITGIGVKQHGEKRFIHIDNLTSKDTPTRPWIWSYP